MTGRIFFKALALIVFVLICTVTIMDILISRAAEAAYVDRLTRDLTDKAHMAVATMGARPVAAEPDYKMLRQLAVASRTRLTLVARGGEVLLDTESDATTMQNHSNREEVQAALSNRLGSSRRQSATTGKDQLYVAVPCPAGALRLSMPITEVNQQVGYLLRHVVSATAIAALPALAFALFLARRYSSKIGQLIQYAGELAQGNFRARLQEQGKDELGVLGAELNQTGERLQQIFEQFQREHAELEKQERVRKDFIINVSHELRTPLASIQGYTETLLDGAMDDPQHNQRFLQIIRNNAERLGRIIADLLTLSRIEMRITRFQFGYWRVIGLLEECADSMLPLAEKRGVQLIVEKESITDQEVWCDGESIQQVLGNLVENAIKYTPVGGAVSLRARELSAIGTTRPPFMELLVTDTGAGIPLDDQPRLFERFYRVDKARSREMGGTGLGLAIVKHLVHAHGGEVSVISQPGNGSTFRFTLPTRDIGLSETHEIQQEFTAS
jgi:two-component system, OmpR family, phosphate regulon sensor histidine kinase PhoR